MTVLFDSSALVDLLTESDWSPWVVEQMRRLRNEGFVFNQIIYAEVSVPFEESEAIDDLLEAAGVHRQNLPWEAALPAGRAYVEYRRRGGLRTSPLPDFYIGAHAVVAGMSLLTRDATRYRTYFPELQLIAPN